MTDRGTDHIADWQEWPLDREVVLARVVNAPVELAFRAWSDATQIVKWFGPDGMRLETREIDIRSGGVWRFDMVAPDGTRYSNRMEFVRVTFPVMIEALHGADIDNDPDRFRLLVTFDPQENGKTVVTLRQLHPSAARRAIVIGFGAVEYGAQTLQKLDVHLAGVEQAST
jgi:uncharacterized protein YndB with AHSA1/START domain